MHFKNPEAPYSESEYHQNVFTIFQNYPTNLYKFKNQNFGGAFHFGTGNKTTTKVLIMQYSIINNTNAMKNICS